MKVPSVPTSPLTRKSRAWGTQDTLKRAALVIKCVSPPSVKTSFLRKLGVPNWYITAKNSELKQGHRLIATVIRLLWCCDYTHIFIRNNIPKWNHRMGFIATLVLRLKNKLPHILGQISSRRSQRGRIRSALSTSSCGSLPSLGDDPYTDYSGLGFDTDEEGDYINP